MKILVIRQLINGLMRNIQLWKQFEKNQIYYEENLILEGEIQFTKR